MILSHIVTVSLKDKEANVLFGSRLATEKYNTRNGDLVRHGVNHTFDRVVGANPVLRVGVKPYILRMNPT